MHELHDDEKRNPIIPQKKIILLSGKKASFLHCAAELNSPHLSCSQTSKMKMKDLEQLEQHVKSFKIP